MATHIWRKLFQGQKLPSENVPGRINILQDYFRSSCFNFFTFIHSLQKYHECPWMGRYRRSQFLLQLNWISKKGPWSSWQSGQPSFPIWTFAKSSSNYCPIFRALTFYCVGQYCLRPNCYQSHGRIHHKDQEL